jgi:hypothetical protein
MGGPAIGQSKARAARRDRVAESSAGSFFLSGPYIDLSIGRTIARSEIAEYIEDLYNPKRRHTHLGGVGPEVFETAGSRD